MCSKSALRKCHCCKEFFAADSRNAYHQRYCSKPPCQKASKRASQRKWLSHPKNRTYFRDDKNVERVQAWRKDHPGYWRKKTTQLDKAQVPAPQASPPISPLVTQASQRSGTLQDLCLANHPMFVGLVSMITGVALQEDIALTTRRIEARGRNILGIEPPELSANRL